MTEGEQGSRGLGGGEWEGATDNGPVRAKGC